MPPRILELALQTSMLLAVDEALGLEISDELVNQRKAPGPLDLSTDVEEGRSRGGRELGRC